MMFRNLVVIFLAFAAVTSSVAASAIEPNLTTTMKASESSLKLKSIIMPQHRFDVTTLKHHDAPLRELLIKLREQIHDLRILACQLFSFRFCRDADLSDILTRAATEPLDAFTSYLDTRSIAMLRDVERSLIMKSASASASETLETPTMETLLLTILSSHCDDHGHEDCHQNGPDPECKLCELRCSLHGVGDTLTAIGNVVTPSVSASPMSSLMNGKSNLLTTSNHHIATTSKSKSNVASSRNLLQNLGLLERLRLLMLRLGFLLERINRLICDILQQGPECYLMMTNMLIEPVHTFTADGSSSGVTLAQIHSIVAEERRNFYFSADVDVDVDIDMSVDDDDSVDELDNPVDKCTDDPDVCTLRSLIRRALSVIHRIHHILDSLTGPPDCPEHPTVSASASPSGPGGDPTSSPSTSPVVTSSPTGSPPPPSTSPEPESTASRPLPPSALTSLESTTSSMMHNYFTVALPLIVSFFIGLLFGKKFCANSSTPTASSNTNAGNGQRVMVESSNGVTYAAI